MWNRNIKRDVQEAHLASETLKKEIADIDLEELYAKSSLDLVKAHKILVWLVVLFSSSNFKLELNESSKSFFLFKKS